MYEDEVKLYKEVRNFLQVELHQNCVFYATVSVKEIDERFNILADYNKIDFVNIADLNSMYRAELIEKEFKESKPFSDLFSCLERYIVSNFDSLNTERPQSIAKLFKEENTEIFKVNFKYKLS